MKIRRTAFIILGGAVVIIVVAAVTDFLWQQYWMAHSPSVQPRSATFSVDPATVRAGGTLTLVGEFRRAYETALLTGSDKIRVLDEAGNDVYYTLEELGPAAGLPAHGFTPLIEIGCTLGLAPPSWPPKRLIVHREAFNVLPATEPGTYTFLLEPGAYCNGWPRQTVKIEFSVVANG